MVREKVNGLNNFINSKNINLSANTLLLSVIRCSIKYGSEVWKGIRD